MADLGLYENFLEHARVTEGILNRRRSAALRKLDLAFEMPDAEFVGLFRLNKGLCRELIEELEPYIPARRGGISVVSKVLSALSFYASGSYQRFVGASAHHKMHQVSVSNCMRAVTQALNHEYFRRKYIRFPQTREERNVIKNGFYQKFGIPGVVGCIDGTHIAIVRPAQFEERFFNRKRYHSLNAQVVCDSDLNVLNIDASHGGASHDSFIWNHHPLKQHLEHLHQAENETLWFLETSWSRRCSTETVFSVQGKETDFVQDSSDTELGSGDDKDVEYEPATASEQEAAITADSSGQTDMDLMSSGAAPLPPDCTTDGQRASSDAGSASDSELDLPAYWACARCRGTNDNSRYRYCRRCFKIRKDFFPPRPRRKEKRTGCSQDGGLILSQDSGIESLNSQEMKLSQDAGESSAKPDDRLGKALPTKRRADSAEREYKRPRLESQSDVESKTVDVAPLVATVSDPSITIESLEAYKGYTTDAKDLCIICLTEPKTGVFVHRRVAHICCCYKCAVKVWSKAKRCPICNCKVSNVLKAVVM